MKSTITREQLLSRKPCEEGLDYFDRLAPNGVLEFDWTRDKQIEFIQGEGRKWFNWLRTKNFLPLWEMEHATLPGANLSGARLYEVDLFGANLSGADLSGADLGGANLSGADLSKANLFKANLFKANLFGAKLSLAVLSRADLRGANLRESRLEGADLQKSFRWPMDTPRQWSIADHPIPGWYVEDGILQKE